MFFVLSKILYFIIQPIVWFVGFLGFAYFTKNQQKRRLILRGLFWGIILLTNPFLSNRIFHAWEYPAVPMQSMRDTFDVGIVLGGFSAFDVYPSTDRLNFNSSVNRLTDAVVLYKKGLVKKLLITGGDGRLVGKSVNEADATLTYLMDMGIAQNDILIENNAKNTRENAVFSKVLLEKNSLANAKCLLITSAFHMRRSMGCFKKVGINFQPFPAHFIAERLEWNASSTFMPDNKAFWNWEIFIKEWVGYGVYWLQGYI